MSEQQKKLEIRKVIIGLISDFSPNLASRISVQEGVQHQINRAVEDINELCFK